MNSGFYTLDAYFPEKKLAVEINGTSHYYGQTQHPLSKHTHKQNFLKAVGINFVNIDVYDCKDFETKSIKKDVIVNKIHEALVNSKLDSTDPIGLS